VGSLCWSRILAAPVTLWREEPTLEQVCWQDLRTCGGPTLEHSLLEVLNPVERTHAEELQPMGRTHVGGVCGELSPVCVTPLWSWRRV